MYLNDPANCPVRPPDGPGALRRRLLGALGLGGGGPGEPAAAPDAPPRPPPPPPPAITPKQFLGVAAATLAVSVAGGVALGVGAMALYRARPHAAVYGAIALQVGLPLSAGFAALASGAPLGAAAPGLLTAGLVAFVYYLYRAQLGLVARLLGTAAQAVSRVWGVVVVAAGIQLAAALLCAPLAASALLAYANGRVVPSPAAAGPAPPGGGGQGGDEGGAGLACVTAAGDPTPCCAWQPDGWALGLMALCAVALTWTSLLAFCIKTYVVSGAVSAWYFSPAGAPAPKDATRAALANALGPSLGSCALAAWLLACISWARQGLRQLRENARDSFLAQVLLSCVDALYAILEQLSKFGVVMAAITGEPFLEAARRSTALLSRNLLDTVAVWVFPANVVGLTNLALAGAWAALAGASSYRLAFAPAEARAAAAAAAAGAPGADSAGSLALPLAALVGLCAFGCGLAALSFLASVLLSAADAVYVCFAIDRDRAAVSREDVHEVMALLPASKKAAEAAAAGGREGPGGGIVEQPGGGYAFGAGRPAAF